MFCFASPHVHDVSYHPDVSEEKVDPTNINDIPGERKFIVFESQLMMLFKLCRSCGQKMVELKTSTMGTLFEVNGICPDGHVLHWESQPVVRRIPAGNLLLAAAILLSDQTFTSFANLADVLNLVMFGERCYVIVIPWPRGICLIYMPCGPRARAYISGESRVAMV